MYRAALRSTTRAARSAASTTTLTPTSRRYLSSKADKPRTWKGAAVRWGLAFGALYWYNTSPLFADEPLPQTIPAPPQFSDADLPTVESVIEKKRKEAAAKAQKAAPVVAPAEEKKEEKKEQESPVTEETLAAVDAVAPPPPGSPEALEEEAGQQGAFNPETGEINWDCPCLGGMADGPCGEEFKAAFSCFVYSTEEPKGMDCIDKFQHMQDCFKKYPEIYGAEIDGEDGDESLDAPAGAEDGSAAPKAEEKDVPESPAPAAAAAPIADDKQSAAPVSAPKAASDATEANRV